MADQETDIAVKQTAWEYTKRWGKNPVAPTLLATLILAQHLQPPKFLPLLFPPVLLFSSYLNILDNKVDAAGISAAWSGLYMLLASRRKQPLSNKLRRGALVRGVTMGLCGTNLVAGGLVYALERRKDEGAGTT